MQASHESARDRDAYDAEARWLRAFARRFTDDAAAIEDVVQETWLVALARAPTGTLPPRRWLTRVLRNQVLRWRRRESAALQRLRAPAACDGSSSDRERAGARELVETVVAAVRRLPAAQRRAVEMRFLEGLPPRVIAARLGRPVKTVDTRLARGLRRLRRSL